ncbi:MAG TPA: biotin/lipoyl-binding protein, partial [Acidimicrobiales bacterium]|nr:biotin/lipoyl-binding protein [Acidimicrobiales bacterium]
MTMAPEERTALDTQPVPVTHWDTGEAGPEADAGVPPEIEPPRRGWWGRHWKPVVAILVVAALVAGGGAAYLLTRSSGKTYRTVAATIGDVQQTTTATGTIEPATEANVNFAVAGTVDGVKVTSGETVKAGQELATLQTATLESDLEQAQSSLDTAESSLASAQDNQTVVQAKATVTSD